MKNLFCILFSYLIIVGGFAQQQPYAIVIHGGAGTILKQNMTPEKEAAYKAALDTAIRIGYAKLQEGKTSLDAVESVIRYLEDCPLFNAGKGAVFTNEGKNELDAAIMDGKTLKAGAVASVTIIKNPISTARAVMEKSPHVLLIGKGAEKFAKENGQVIVSPKYFFTQKSYDALKKAKEKEAEELKNNHTLVIKNRDEKFGTVGCVALDNFGNLAAGTSTGGMTNKRFGRVGDAPIIGAGTYANNNTAAISCTGWGEFFIRSVAAYDVSALMEYKGMSLKDAADTVIKKIAALGGDGGLIGLDRKGNMTMSFSTAGMYRAAITKDGKVSIEIYK